MNVKTIVSAIALASIFVAGAAEARISNRDGYTEDAKVSRSAHPYLDGARYNVNGQRNPFVDGARNDRRDVYTDGARMVAGLDHVGVSAPPARSADPYLDGARYDANGPRSPYYDGAGIGPRDVYTDGARIAPRDVYTEGAMA
ncbi:hypothetical protein [Cupriavidus lacunae]|uniref:Hydroxyquinol 1,2-dioxygenase n=1 Tax=Cupriavidus lacunae TaxID=2666307 RepID=A0A370NHY6_9BURK|nr:hypothetical protein [Cupriavidus lacunae]RDK05194.1 hypothetical protein DN412_38340 [Cupriavidus lacunae]